MTGRIVGRRDGAAAVPLSLSGFPLPPAPLPLPLRYPSLFLVAALVLTVVADQEAPLGDGSGEVHRQLAMPMELAATHVGTRLIRAPFDIAAACPATVDTTARAPVACTNLIE